MKTCVNSYNQNRNIIPERRVCQATEVVDENGVRDLRLAQLMDLIRLAQNCRALD